MALDPALLMKLPAAANTKLPLAWLSVIVAPALSVMLPPVSNVALSVKVVAPLTAMLPAVLLPNTMLLNPSVTKREPPLNQALDKANVPEAPVPKPMVVPAVLGWSVSVPPPVRLPAKLMLSAVRVRLLLPALITPVLLV